MLCLCPCCTWVLPTDAVLPNLILCGLATWYSSPSIAPTQLRIMWPTLQALLHVSLQAAAPPALLYHHRLLSTGCSSCAPRAAPVVSLHGLWLLHATATVALWLVRGCTWRSAPPGTYWLQDHLLCHGPLLGCRELLLCTWCSACPSSMLPLISVELFLLNFHVPLSQLLFHSSCFLFLNLLSRSITNIICGSALLRGAGPCWSSWS